MSGNRRQFILGAALLGAVTGSGAAQAATGTGMHGLIGKMIAQPGQRDALIAILLEGTAAMPGCLSYIVAKDVADPNAIWITEVWDSAKSHDASLKLPPVRQAITRARPLIAGFDSAVTTMPVGGFGLSAA